MKLSLNNLTNIQIETIIERATEEASELWEPNTPNWYIAYGAIFEMWRMILLQRSYLSGRPGEREDISNVAIQSIIK